MTKLFAGVTTAVVTAGVALVIATPASAATVPASAITNDPNASNGTLSFYDSSGVPITSGGDLTHLFDYALASTPGRSGATKATMYLAFPDHNKTDSTTWFKSQKSLATTYPNSNAPAPLKTSANPLVSLKSSDGNLASLLSTTEQDHTAGYDGIVQVRAYDTGAGAPFQSSPFWASDIYFDQAANTWQQVYPAVASASSTATTLSADPASPSTVGTSVTFTASVSPSVAGTVQFKDGTTDLGAPVTVSNGTATYSTSTLPAGAHSITATFAPTDTAAYAGSTSQATSYTVNAAAAATDTTTTLSVSPTSPAAGGSTETLTATVTPAGASGTVQFKDGSTDLGSPAVVTNGSAETTTKLPSGSHSLTATFVPTDPADFNGSTSTPKTYVVSEPITTSTTLQVSPSSPAPAGQQETLTATVTAGAAGSVVFKDGTDAIGTAVVVDGGTAAKNVTLTSGSHTLTAEFTPVDPAAYTASVSTASTYVVKDPAKPTTTTVAATPASPQQANTAVTFTASVTPNLATGTVQFKDGTDLLGAPVSVVNGSAQYSTSALTKGTHPIIAAFTPDSDVYNASASTPLSFVVAEYPGTPASILATAGNQTATVAWAAPTNDGGTPITGYDLQQSTDGVTWTSAAPGGTRVSTATSKVVTGLTNGAGYFFRVAAINGIGTGAYWSTTTKAVPVSDATVLTISAARVVRVASPTTVGVTLSSARDGSRVVGVPVTLYRRVAGQTAFAAIATVSTTTAGTAGYRVAVTANSQFQWRFAGTARQNPASSAVALVTVAPKVSISATSKKLKHGKKTKIYGTSTPAPTGERVYLQRLMKGKWRTLAATVIKRQKLPNGRTATGYAFSEKLTKRGSYVFRVTTAATGYSLAGVTGRLTVRVT